MITSTYIHIPFCTQICSYCDFCKQFYHQPYIEPYLNALEKEIRSTYRGEIQQTIYIGGGTPSTFSVEELQKLFQILSYLKRDRAIEYTIECNPESLTKEKIDLFVKEGINRVSIGVETTHHEHLKTLNRTLDLDDLKDKIIYLKKNGIDNINLDLIYGIKQETLEEVKQDLDFFLSLQVPHISTYSLILEEHTPLYIQKHQPISEELDASMYEYICSTLEHSGYQHYEFSNFALPNKESRHNLHYWENKTYYGFGLGASGYIDRMRYSNTKSLSNYLKGKFRLFEEEMDPKTDIENQMIVGLRTKKGISISEVEKKYHVSLVEVFPIQRLLRENKLKKEQDRLFIPESLWYVSNEILVEFIKE